MRILMYLPMFYPSIGGIEIMAELLANGFTEAGHEVQVVTLTPGGEDRQFAFPVHRRPSANHYWELVHWAEVLFQRGVALRGVWPLLLLRRHYVVSHGGWYIDPSRETKLIEWVKHQVTRFSLNICPSQAIASHLAGSSIVIPNAYREHLFYIRPEIPRRRDLVFVGRLVSVKGVDVLLKAIYRLYCAGRRISATIIGEGPERGRLSALSDQLGITEFVSFTGALSGNLLAEKICEHRLLVVPSTEAEPFGTVALEGIACGCVVIGTDGGGLDEAIGRCGVVVPRGDSVALADAIENLLRDKSRYLSFRAGAPAHLAGHSPKRTVSRYLDVLAQLSGSGSI